MKKSRILIIEDEALIAHQIKRTLERAGHHVAAICSNSNDAFSALLHLPIDIVLTDIQIKGAMDGIELADIIQKNFNIPIVFLTSFFDDNTLKRVTNIRFSSYIVKPYLEEHLMREIKLAIFRHAKHNKTVKLIEITDSYIYHLQEQILFHDEKPVVLTKKEQNFLYILVLNINQLVPYKQLNLVVWYEKVVDDENRRQLLFRLRKKIPNLDIRTIKGHGYMLRVTSDEEKSAES